MCASHQGTEHDLIERLRAGDEEAFEAMVKEYGGRMLAVARRYLRAEQDARDALQEALISAFRAIGSFAGQSQLSTWLHRIVVNAALMQLRKRRRRNEESIEDLLPSFSESGDWVKDGRCGINLRDAALEQCDTREMVRRCIDRLPDKYRKVLMMRDIEDLDTKRGRRNAGSSPQQRQSTPPSRASSITYSDPERTRRRKPGRAKVGAAAVTMKRLRRCCDLICHMRRAIPGRASVRGIGAQGWAQRRSPRTASTAPR